MNHGSDSDSTNRKPEESLEPPATNIGEQRVTGMRADVPPPNIETGSNEAGELNPKIDIKNSKNEINATLSRH
jgi:hypothetical protein